MTAPSIIERKLSAQNRRLADRVFDTPIFKETDEVITDEDPEALRQLCQRTRVAIGRNSSTRAWNQRRFTGIASALRDPDADVIALGMKFRLELFELLSQHPEIQDRI